MPHETTLGIIDNISSTKLKPEHYDLAVHIASIFHDVWRISWGKKNGSNQYTDEPFYVNDTFNIKTNVNVPYNDLPKQFTDLNYNIIMFTLKMIHKNKTDRQLCYFLINEYRRIINTSARGGNLDVIFNKLPEKEKHKYIDIYNLCFSFMSKKINGS